MEGHEGGGRPEERAQLGFELGPAELRLAERVVDPERADGEDASRLLAELHEAPRRAGRRRKVQPGHLADGVAHGVVGRALRELAAVQVGDGHPGKQGGPGAGQGLVAVAEHDQQVGPLGVERRRDAGQGGGRRPGDVELGVALERQRHARRDAVAVGFDLSRPCRRSAARGARR